MYSVFLRIFKQVCLATGKKNANKTLENSYPRLSSKFRIKRKLRSIFFFEVLGSFPKLLLLYNLVSVSRFLWMYICFNINLDY